MRTGGIILCGGQSSRMGTAKALLPFGPERMLQRVVRLLGQAVGPLVVVSRQGQPLPELPAEVIHTHDRQAGLGPLSGLQAGLAALPSEIEAAYATSCDVPLLAAAFVQRMVELLGDHQVAVPHTDGYRHPLAAVYRRSVLPEIEALLAENRLRPMFLFERVPTRWVTADELRPFDPPLATLANLNEPRDYLAALAQAGFSAPPEVLGQLRVD